MKQLITAEQLKMLRRATPAQVSVWATSLYASGHADGYDKGFEDGQKSIQDDAIVMTVDEAIEKIGEDNFNKLTRGDADGY